MTRERKHYPCDKCPTLRKGKPRLRGVRFFDASWVCASCLRKHRERVVKEGRSVLHGLVPNAA